MLEIFLIFSITKRISMMLNRKNRVSTGWNALFILLWIVGEGTGAAIGALLTHGDASGLVYGCALVGAMIGGLIGYGIASLLPPKPL